MNATPAFLCLFTICFTGITIPIHHEVALASQSDGSTSGGNQKMGKPGAVGKGDAGGMPLTGKPKQMPAPRDPSQAVEERLRAGQMEKPIAQGEVSDRLNQLYSGSGRMAGETSAERSTR
jgi:hypothetical protein